MIFAETTIEQTFIDWQKDLGCTYVFSTDISFDRKGSILTKVWGGVSTPRAVKSEVRVKWRVK